MGSFSIKFIVTLIGNWGFSIKLDKNRTLHLSCLSHGASHQEVISVSPVCVIRRKSRNSWSVRHVLSWVLRHFPRNRPRFLCKTRNSFMKTTTSFAKFFLFLIQFHCQPSQMCHKKFIHDVIVWASCLIHHNLLQFETVPWWCNKNC